MTTAARTTARASALVVTALLVAVSLMIVVPPPTMTLLTVAVAAAEYSPLLALAELLWLLVAGRLLRGRRTTRLAAMTLLLAAAAVALWPISRFNAVARDAGAQLGADDDVIRYSPLESFRAPPLRGAVSERAIRYAASDGTPLTLRLHRGRVAGARPTVVVLYGGAWRGGDATQGAALSRMLASSGFTVAALDYRHAPAARFPAQLDDVRLGIALLHDSATAWGVDTARIALLGRSSGGHLAELAAWSPGAPHVRAVIALYAPFDLVRGYDELPTPDPIDIRAVLRGFTGGTPAEQARRYHDASPATWVRPGLPPTLLIYGARDHIVKPDFNRTAAHRLRAARVPVVQVEIPWAEHGFDMAPGGLGEQLSQQAIAEFLARWVGVP